MLTDISRFYPEWRGENPPIRYQIVVNGPNSSPEERMKFHQLTSGKEFTQTVVAIGCYAENQPVSMMSPQGI